MSPSHPSSPIGWYVLFGALHECSHVLTAILTNSAHGILDIGYIDFLFSVLLGRHCVIPEAGDAVRHAGWIASLVLAILVRNHKPAATAAFLTALEALWTDLLQWKVLPAITVAPAAGTFFCGNFGIILLHHLWLSDNGQSALAILEKMVQVTMMRGAQSGGVISYYPTRTDRTTLKGVRSRVVNKKRTDLSKILRRAVQRDVFSKRFPKDYVPVVSGHTRFATSSKATLQGTHPHRWTPASYRRVYNFHVRERSKRTAHSSSQRPSRSKTT